MTMHKFNCHARIVARCGTEYPVGCSNRFEANQGDVPRGTRKLFWHRSARLSIDRCARIEDLKNWTRSQFICDKMPDGCGLCLDDLGAVRKAQAMIDKSLAIGTAARNILAQMGHVSQLSKATQEKRLCRLPSGCQRPADTLFQN